MIRSEFDVSSVRVSAKLPRDTRARALLPGLGIAALRRLAWLGESVSIHEKSENLGRSVTVQLKVRSPDESEPQFKGM
jgi:hypothetical protein